MMHFVDKNNPENIIDAAIKRQKDRASGQTSFFDMFGDVEGSGFEVSVPDPDGQEWDRHLKLSQEKEVLGIYVSDHPLRPFEYALAKRATSRSRRSIPAMKFRILRAAPSTRRFPRARRCGGPAWSRACPSA